MYKKNPVFIEYLIKNAQEPIEDIETDISAEEMLINKYLDLYDSFEDRMKGCKENKEEETKIREELKLILKELNAVSDSIKKREDKIKIDTIKEKFEAIQKFNFVQDFEKSQGVFGYEAPTIAQSDLSVIVKTENFDSETVEDVLKKYAEDACKGIEYLDSNILYKIDNKNKIINIYAVKEEKQIPVLTITVNDDLFVDGIFPNEHIYDFCPLYSLEFYQKYWKRIVESIGHYCLKDKDIIIVASRPLPDIPNNKNESCQLKGWSIVNGEEKNIELVFSSPDNTWFINPMCSNVPIVQKVASKFPEQKYFNAIVRCIDKSLDKLFGRTGMVNQIVPQNDCVFLDVNFGRGLGIIRLMDDLKDPAKTQIELI